MQVAEKTFGAISKGVGFFRGQQYDWKVTMLRSSAHRFFYQMEFPYRSVYVRALGATGTQLGLVNSIGMGIAGLVSPFTGWLIDRTGVKKIYLIGIILLAMSYLTYGVAQSWTIIIFAMILFYLGNTTSLHGCTVICGNSLASEERVTGMAICETFAAGILGLAGPMLGALLVTNFGGVNVSGIRPLFFIGLVGVIGTFILIITQLSNRRWGTLGKTSPNFFKDLSELFKQGRHLKRFLVIASIGTLEIGMVLPFIQVFANEVKGADQYILGAMVTGMALTPLLLGIPLGRLADKVGRKKVLYLTIPLVWISYLMLIWAPNPGFLVASGVLHGFYHVSAVTTGAMSYELVPPDQMGRWMGTLRFFRMMLGAGTVYLAGVIWDTIGPQYVFLAIIGLGLLIRIPLLIGMPETLGSRLGTEKLLDPSATNNL
ncbi:MFS transporter [Chloroflexota bacterium]